MPNWSWSNIIRSKSVGHSFIGALSLTNVCDTHGTGDETLPIAKQARETSVKEHACVERLTLVKTPKRKASVIPNQKGRGRSHSWIGFFVCFNVIIVNSNDEGKKPLASIRLLDKSCFGSASRLIKINEINTSATKVTCKLTIYKHLSLSRIDPMVNLSYLTISIDTEWFGCRDACCSLVK